MTIVTGTMSKSVPISEFVSYPLNNSALSGGYHLDFWQLTLA